MKVSLKVAGESGVWINSWMILTAIVVALLLFVTVRTDYDSDKINWCSS